MTLCACGCGQETKRNQNSYQPNKYIIGHSRKGKHISEEHKDRISEANTKEYIIHRQDDETIRNKIFKIHEKIHYLSGKLKTVEYKYAIECKIRQLKSRLNYLEGL